MIYGSLFSGIEGASVAWAPLGWRCAWVAEIDPFARALLAHHYPDVPNLGDVERIDTDAIEPVDLVVFGSPCQSFSVAGKRLGLDDPRGNMALVGLRVVGKLRPRWVVWENVPGVLSSDEGRDFGAFLGLLGELGYGFAYAVCDAQHWGVPQRRRRVFVVGCLGDWRPAAAVLFEPESLRGDSPPRREAGEGAARPVASCAPGGSGYRNDADTADSLIARCVATGSNAQRYDYETETLVTAHNNTGQGWWNDADVAAGLRDMSAVAFNVAPGKGDLKDDIHVTRADATKTLDAWGSDPAAHQGGTAIQAGMSVRRLTPRECERLQGLPDDYTLIPYRGQFAADGPRYRAIGNGFAVPVVRWIGQRIQLFAQEAAE